MKKSIKLLAAMLSISMLASCSSSSSSAPDEAAGDDSSGETITISLGHPMAESHHIHTGAVEFKKYVEEQSSGAIQVELHPNAVLGGNVQMIESVALNTLTMSLPAAANLTTYSEAFNVLNMPYLFKDVETAFQAIDEDFGPALADELNGTGIKVLGYHLTGVQNMTNNVRPITTPSDLDGVKMRVMESPLFIDTHNAFGSNPTPMSFSELFTALQQGTVDGQENPLSIIYESKFQEVQKYLSITEHMYDFAAIIVNEDFYNKLSAEHRSIVDEGTKLYLVDLTRQLEVENNESYISKLEEEGMEVNTLTDEARSEFTALTEEVYAKYASTFGDDIVELINKYR